MIIFNADDLGMSEEIDYQILSMASKKIIQSASVSVVNGVTLRRFKIFTNEIDSKFLGLHINLTEGRPFSSDLNLINAKGYFKSALDLFELDNCLSEESIFNEMKLQLDYFISLSGTRPNHLDVHQHFAYLNPIAFKVFLKLATEENIKIRSPLPFIDNIRLQSLIDSVKTRYEISVPFSAEKRSIELSRIFNIFKVETRTQDCLIEIPEKNEMRKISELNRNIEVVCHPHHFLDKIKLLLSIKKIKQL